MIDEGSQSKIYPIHLFLHQDVSLINKLQITSYVLTNRRPPRAKAPRPWSLDLFASKGHYRNVFPSEPPLVVESQPRLPLEEHDRLQSVDLLMVSMLKLAAGPPDHPVSSRIFQPLRFTVPATPQSFELWVPRIINSIAIFVISL